MIQLVHLVNNGGIRMNGSSLPEQMLDAYLGLCTCLWNRRITSNMSFNEALVCYFIRKAQDQGPSHVTATWLCEQTQIAKSQMNRILNGLENLGILRRSRSGADKRQVFLSLNPEKQGLFEQEHRSNVKLVQRLQAKFGIQRSETLTQLLGDFVEMLRSTDLLEERPCGEEG